MANYGLWNLGAALRGQQDYEQLQQQKEAAQQQIEYNRARLDELKDATAQAKKQREEAPEIAKGTWNTLLGIGAPPGAPAGQMPEPPPVQAPQPGQQSVPMMQGGPPPLDDSLQGAPQDQGPPQGPPQGMPPGPPPGMQGGPPPGPPQGPQVAPQGPPAIPPYQTMAGAAAQPQGGPMGIPPPPQQGPRPNSLSISDAARLIQSQGVNDPVKGLKILEQLNPYLTQEAKAEAAAYKIQLDYMLKDRALNQKATTEERVAKNQTATLEQREAASKRADETKRAGQANTADYRSKSLWLKQAQQQAAGGTGDSSVAPGVDAATWNYLIKSEKPSARGGMEGAVNKNIEKIAKENGMSVQELITASADVKSKLAAKKSFEVRAQNTTRAENQILREIPLAEQAISKLDLSTIPAFQKGGLAALRALGDPRVTTLDQSLTTIFNEFEGIRTGNPGALHVADIQNAQHDIENARTEPQLKAAIAGMRRTMHQAQESLKDTRKTILDDISSTLTKNAPAGGHGAPSAGVPQGWTVRVK